MIAYKVEWYRGNCDADELVGYYTTKAKAVLARQVFIDIHNLKPNGLCCHNEKRVEIEEINIQE